MPTHRAHILENTKLYLEENELMLPRTSSSDKQGGRGRVTPHMLSDCFGKGGGHIFFLDSCGWTVDSIANERD